MRIGFDMLAVQSPHHGHRGIGRYSRHLVSALLARDDGHQFTLYAHDDLQDYPVLIIPRDDVRIDLTLLPPEAIRQPPLDRIGDKPMKRASLGAVEALLRE